MDFNLIVYGFVMLIGLLGIGSRFVPGSKPDNQVEEACEEVIKKQTGFDIDLSPSTPEHDDEKDSAK